MKYYLLDVLHINKTTADILFIVFCLTAPVAGILFGGCFIQRHGGYESIKAMYFILMSTSICTVISIGVFFSTKITYFCVLMFLFLFFGSSISPCLGGSVLRSLPPELRGSGNSLQNIIVNIFGYTPGPYIYGFIYEKTKSFAPTLAFSVCLGSSFIGFLLILKVVKIRKNNSRMSSRAFAEEKENIELKKV